MEDVIKWYDNGKKYLLSGSVKEGDRQCGGCAFYNTIINNCPLMNGGLICDDEGNLEVNWVEVKDEVEEAPYNPEHNQEFPSSLDAKPGVKHDSGKPMYRLVPPFALEEIAKNLTYGESKYSAFNWQNVPNAQDRYIDAAMRHVEAYRKGEKLDPENNLQHLAAAAVNLMFLLEFELNPNLKDKQ